MNKQTFKKLRSQFRKAERTAYLSGDRESFSVRLREAQKAFRENNPTDFHFSWFDKPSHRQQIVSMRVFAHLDYPFDGLTEPRWN
ncbi:hypothetical protein NVP1271B_71 [Vibrio phage 1.271.B._10N.286.54.B4]|nr:hypothetical protein NVP1027O_71 [Vibrio phage 1.027.O._10N.286.54.B8]AUR92402.1 hypothetical protein NVP1171O_75 [Vibrio phage 1.171.O._10N.261.52.F12]AUR94451.1 hypothetical protein NVP1194O_71 [Vibrio phage 1.194.O._10N.286.54.B1]AUR94539.1 hypothetical protein NVP1195O_74 [Vibrio phage 1.195.O._10N.286.54.C8]AUR94624.1 hypothetical protein NVP1196O_71 [Vibrio phage 1.196.O._10N.286.54.E12]AUR95091.1 hypothetical protein NVP1200O_71 [Vibrio phage 1.200.O._10N.286.55.E1]AUR99579.1 hypoth